MDFTTDELKAVCEDLQPGIDLEWDRLIVEQR